MAHTITGINARSTYEQCVTLIEESVKEVMLDQADAELSEDEVYCDLAAALLIDANRPVAREVCRVTLGFVPGALLEHWRRQDAAREVYAKARKETKAAERKVAKVQAERDAQAAAQEKLRSATCPRCFTVRAPSGACNC